MLVGGIAGGSRVAVLLCADDDKSSDVGGSTLTVVGCFNADEIVVSLLLVDVSELMSGATSCLDMSSPSSPPPMSYIMVQSDSTRVR